MLNTGMNYGLGTTGVSSPKDILSNAYSNPMVMCSPTGSINVNGAQLPTNYENDFLMPKFDIGNCLNGQVSMQGSYPQSEVGDQFVSTQTPQQGVQDAYQQQVTGAYPQQEVQSEIYGQEQEQQENPKSGFNLKKNGAILGFLSPVLFGAYKILKGAKTSSIFNKELFVKCPILGVAGIVLGALAEKIITGNKSAA